MFKRLHRFLFINIALVLALVGSGLLQPAIQANAAAPLPNMYVSLASGSGYYTSTVYSGTQITLQAKVQNAGNVALQLTANLTTPTGWTLNDNYTNCPGSLDVGGVCTFTWVFTPQASGQVYLRVYVRGYYTDASGNTNRITGSPAFLFNILPTYQVQSQVDGETITTTSTVPPALVYPTMSVSLVANDQSYYAATVPTGKQFILRANVTNLSFVPLQVVANLAVPNGWGVTQNTYNGCPASSPLLGHKDTCAISWYFNPLVAGQVFLRVYVRAYYTDAAGNTQRITQSPLFIINAVP